MSYIRKTRDYYSIQGYYYGAWEEVTVATSWGEAKEHRKCYRENEPGTAFRIKILREPAPFVLHGPYGATEHATLGCALEGAKGAWHILQSGRIVARSSFKF